ncbi:MAG: gliding-motility protein MglA [Kiritimatiellae bacterium]|nr:gliding-motility protein MglA [Kiritimatiellia bacterium]
MSFVNLSKREISFKIVFYGPPLSGKTTNLEHLHEVMPDDIKGKMTMLSTQQDRTLYFDFLPLKSDAIKGYVSKFQLYTVPGQAIYNQTRRIVLTGVDGLVFVADSQWDEMEHNVESFENLEENLKTYNRTLDEIPFILQFNKRDLDNVAPVEYMDFVLNQRENKALSFETVACDGTGVHESLNMVCKMVMAQFIDEHNMNMSSSVGDDSAVAV